MNAHKNNLLKDSLIFSLFIGILGSALWEKLFSPLADRLFLFINNLISQFSRASSDSLYRSISEGFNEKFSTIAAIAAYFTFVMIVLLSLYLPLAISNHRKIIIIDKKEEPNKIRYSNRKSRLKCILQELRAILLLFEIVTLLISMFYFNGRIQFINKSITKCLNNLEIISPYINDLEYKQFKSRFYQINSKDDYDSLISDIEEKANSHDIILK